MILWRWWARQDSKLQTFIRHLSDTGKIDDTSPAGIETDLRNDYAEQQSGA
jgi:hypothetical protein